MIARIRPWALLLAIPFPLLVVAVASTAPLSPVGVAITGLLGAVCLGAVVSGLSGSDPEGERVAAELATPEHVMLGARWSSRSRYCRFLGGTVGFVLAVPAAADAGLVALVLGVLFGVAVGGMAAELHLAGPTVARRSAELAPRTIDDYVPPVDRVMTVMALVGSLVLGGVAQVAGRSAVVTLMAGAVLVLVAAVGTQLVIVRRARPALASDLRRLDDGLRRLAVTRGFSRPATAAAFAAQAVGVVAVEGRFAPLLALLLWLAVLLVLVWGRRPASMLPQGGGS